MRGLTLALALLLMCSPALNAANKQKGTATLKDLQPAGMTDKINKNQIYDLVFATAGDSYTCRTSHDTKLKATDFVVGEDMKFELDGDNGKLKTAAGKEVKCKIVRVEKLTAPAK